MSNRVFNESVIEEAALPWLERFDYVVKHSLEIAPTILAAERNKAFLTPTEDQGVM